MRGGTLLVIFFIISLSAGAFLFQDFQLTGKAISCTSNWSCSDWSPCISKEKIRTCIDTNMCGNPTGRPSEITTCETDCLPDWRCSEWTPEECPESGIQTKDCIDQNNCATPINMPESARECEYKETYEWLFYTIVIMNILTIILVLVLLFSLFYKSNNSSKKIKNSSIKRENNGTLTQRQIPQLPNFNTPMETKASQNSQIKESPQNLPIIPNSAPPETSQKLKSEVQPAMTPPQTQPTQLKKPYPQISPYQNQSLPPQKTQIPGQTRRQSINELMPRSNFPANFKKNKK